MNRFLISVSFFLLWIGAFGASTGFHTSGSKLLDANGNEFVMRGCNFSYAWQNWNNQAQSVIPAAKRIGCNTIRIQLATGARWQRTSRQELERLIKLCEDNKLIAVFNTHDETGSDQISDLMNAVEYWKEMKDVLNAHLSTVIVNISNEWCGSWDSNLWANGYKQAVPALRNAGIKNTLMVDAAGWGQFPKCVQDKGRDVVAADPQNNLIFSVHIYDEAGKSDASAKTSMDYALSAGVPAVVGEFAYKHNYNNVAYQKVMDYAAEKNMGYLVWSWTGNGDSAADCDMFGSYDDSYWKENGTLTVKGPNGIQATSKECSVFDPNAGDNRGEDTPGNDPSGDNVWEGNFESGEWQNLMIPSSYTKDIKAGDKIRIYFQVYPGHDGGHMIFKYPDWEEMTELTQGATGKLPGEYSLFPSSTTMTELTCNESDAMVIAASGFIITGQFVTITKVVFGDTDEENPGGSTGGNEWNGEKSLENWDNLIITPDYTSQVKTGDHIVIYFTVKPGALSGNMTFKDGNWKEYASLKSSATNLDQWGTWQSGVTSTILTVGADSASAIASTGFIISGNDVIVKQVIFGGNLTTGLEVATDAGTCPVEYFTLQGVRVMEPAHGMLLIRRQGSDVRKIVY